MKTFVVIIFALALAACSSTVNLQQSPSDLVLVNVQRNSNSPVTYTFSSRLPDEFRTVNNSSSSYVFYLNNSMQNNIAFYMQNKFDKLGDSVGSHVSLAFRLDSANISYKYSQNAAEVMSALLGGKTSGETVINTKLFVHLAAQNSDSTLLDREVVSENQYSKATSGDERVEDIYSEGVNGAISKFIILTDKYLKSCGL